MLAHNTKSLTMIFAIAVAMTTSFAIGQQPQQPSQRYQPVPPSVHIPPDNMERIQLQQAKRNLQDGLNSTQKRNLNKPASYRFSDADAPMPAFETGTGTVQQTSYVAEVPNDVRVPNILAASNQQPLRSGGMTSGPKMAKSQDSLTTPQFLPVNVESEPISATNTEMVEKIQRSHPRVDPDSLKQQDEFVERLMSKTTSKISASSSRMQPDQLADSFKTETPMLTAQPIQVASIDGPVGEPVNNIRRVSSESSEPPRSQAIDSQPMTPRLTPEISLVTPGIEVQTFGPQTIGINKNSTFRVVVTNRGTTAAKQVLIGIKLPAWVDIANTTLSNGRKEVTDGVDRARLLWTVEQVPANSTQTLTIDTVPRKAERFDLGVEWTFSPQIGATSIEVTEPRLEMKIVGPQDVLFGEKAIYHVTVRNPGTGAAENVTVMLPEALGGERASLGEIAAGSEKNFQVELLARTAGQLDLAATAKADGNLNTQAVRQVNVRRAILGVIIDGPPMKYAGGVGQYTITITNSGDATALGVVGAIALPGGIKYVGGVENAKEIEGGLRWQVGTIESGDQRTFKINCELNASGDLQIEAGARGQGDLAASSACITAVETVADLVLTVMDPKGPLPTGDNVTYTIRVTNRGTRAARDVELVMQFSVGIEPHSAQGLQHRVVPGQILFSPIAQVDPGEEMEFQVIAKAIKPGTHVFRAQLICADSEAREIAEGTTRFFGEHIDAPVKKDDNATADSNNEFAPTAESSEFKR